MKKAPDFLEQGAKEMRDRAALRESPEGERSMKAAVAAFNAIFGTKLTETQGWLFMTILKVARASQGKFNPDDYVDMAAYSALAGECENTKTYTVKASADSKLTLTTPVDLDPYSVSLEKAFRNNHG